MIEDDVSSVYYKEIDKAREEGRKQGAVDALNSVEFRQSLLQAKVTELEKIKSNFLDERHEYLNKETIQIKEYIELRLKELKG